MEPNYFQPIKKPTSVLEAAIAGYPAIKLKKASGTKSVGGAFNELEISAVWSKARAIPGLDMRFWRQDLCGAYMSRQEYGNTKSIYGWEIDHIQPVAYQGTDNINNLQALQWENNRRKGDTVGNFSCAVTYRG
jgi:hypothetical protein